MSKQKEQREWKKYLELVGRIQSQTSTIPVETSEGKAKRIKGLLGNWEKFCKYYFARYLDSDFAYFHKKLSEAVIKDPDILAVAEWPREHAKSVIIDIFIPLFLKAKGELTGVLLGSSTAEKAKGLLSDLQAELEGNQLYINDFGPQVNFGDWQSGHFTTKDGLGFWAFGRGQSPRGCREANLRPNYGVIDDIDDKKIVNNIERVLDATEWVFEDFFGALSINGARLIVAGNRIHKNSILAHIVGDVKSGDPKRKGIFHQKVYAIEDPMTHEKAGVDSGMPAWWQRYTIEKLVVKMEKMGYRSARKEFFHEHIENGLIFKKSWIKWVEVLPIQKYDCVVTYTDPSFSIKGDFKAHVTIGKKGKYYDILNAWNRQASIKSMVVAHYDIFDMFGTYSTYWIEANFMQDRLLKDDYDREEDERKIPLPYKKDKSKKPKKEVRIENLSPLFERGLVRFNAAKKDDEDMQTLKDQFLGFGGGGHDDGPDATEGAIAKANKRTKSSKHSGRSGKYKRKQR